MSNGYKAHQPRVMELAGEIIRITGAESLILTFVFEDGIQCAGAVPQAYQDRVNEYMAAALMAAADSMASGGQGDPTITPYSKDH